ncbi:LysR family transcriptional regulator [Pseudocitrobacter cyperus]|uniref:LysR family transcriptional regulator n=1 Tax=Pseudocitrobacter cyperus TaxID=3112843 RepID=A0ABV0HGU6_9ENTR
MKANIADFATFLAVARHQSFRGAADALGLSPSAISHAIKQLEQRLKIRLFNRTTRSVALTEAGRSLYERLRPAFEDIQTMLDEVNNFRETPSGTLRFNAARIAARVFLMPLLTKFTRRYPDIKIEVSSDDRLVDIVAEGFDAGIRLGAIVEQDMIAVPIGPPIRLTVVATPAHFARFGRPEHPRDLLQHPCVVFRYPSGRPYHWEFHGPEGQLDVATTGNITVDDIDAELDAVLMGAGVGYLLNEQVDEHLKSGRLESVLEEWLPARPGFQLYYPNRHYMSCGLRAFLDFIKQPDNDEINGPNNQACATGVG